MIDRFLETPDSWVLPDTLWGLSPFDTERLLGHVLGHVMSGPRGWGRVAAADEVGLADCSSRGGL